MSNDTQERCRVYKYQFDMGDWVSLYMPQGAEVLCVQVQSGTPCLWARVDADAPLKIRHFRIAGTGHDLGSNVGRCTFQLIGGSLVFPRLRSKGLTCAATSTSCGPAP